MPNKSFEEQVREELSGLHIKPNDAVWEAVAANLQQKRKRRWGIWLLTLLAGLSGASFWFLTENSNHTVISSKTISKDRSQSILSSRNGYPAQEGSKNLPIAGTEKILQPKNRHAGNNIQSPFIFSFVDDETSEKKKADLTIKERVSSSITDNSVSTSTSSVPEKVVESISPISITKNDSVLAMHEVMGIHETAIIGSLQYDTIPSVAMDTLKNITKQKQTSKWVWRIGVQGGQSGIRNSLGSLFKGYRANPQSGFVINNPIPGSPTTGAGSGSLGTTPQSNINDYSSFGVSLEIMRTMGKRKKNNIGFQLGYDLYQTSVRVGSINTGTLQFSNVNRANEANVYYGVKDSANYTSSYHFIRIGVQYYRSLNWIAKTNLRWYVGIGLNSLISSNGLHIGTVNNNIYYFRNRSLLQTTQLDVTSGFEFALGKQKRFFVAPQVQYMLSNLSKQTGVNQHLFRPALKLSWQLSSNR